MKRFRPIPGFLRLPARMHKLRSGRTDGGAEACAGKRRSGAMACDGERSRSQSVDRRIGGSGIGGDKRESINTSRRWRRRGIDPSIDRAQNRRRINNRRHSRPAPWPWPCETREGGAMAGYGACLGLSCGQHQERRAFSFSRGRCNRTMRVFD